MQLEDVLLELGQSVCRSGRILCQDGPKVRVDVAYAIQATDGQGGYRKHGRGKEPVEGEGVAESSLGSGGPGRGQLLDIVGGGADGAVQGAEAFEGVSRVV